MVASSHHLEETNNREGKKNKKRHRVNKVELRNSQYIYINNIVVDWHDLSGRIIVAVICN